MEREPLLAEHNRRAAVTPAPPPPPSKHFQQGNDALFTLSKPTGWLVNILTIQAELLSTTFLSPLRALVSDAPRVPSAVLLRLAFGLLSAAYACLILVAAMMISILIGVTLVRFWVEDPVSIHRQLHFDYTQAHPVAAVSVADGLKERGIPAGHEARVSLVVVMPESHYNTRVGVFQVTAEAISSTGNVVATSSQPCMLRFQSLPIQMTRTFLLGIPLLIGMRDESQKLVIGILRYKESNHKTEVINVRLKPRAGTVDLPQIYRADIIIKTQLPRSKELVYNWKWAFYVWVPLCVYVTLLTAFICCFKPFGLSRGRSNNTELANEVAKNQIYDFRSGGELSDDCSDVRTRLPEGRRSNLKAVLPDDRQSELTEASGSSPGEGETSDGEGETSEVTNDFGDEFAASESSERVGG